MDEDEDDTIDEVVADEADSVDKEDAAAWADERRDSTPVRVTEADKQRFSANWMVVSWSADEQPVTMQPAIESMKVWLEQMQATSIPQLNRIMRTHTKSSSK